MPVPTSEETRQPAIRDCRSRRRISTSFVLHGYNFFRLALDFRPRGDVMFTHHELVDGACCGLQVIWEIPEELRRERAKLGS
jgi:hypothetical protein